MFWEDRNSRGKITSAESLLCETGSGAPGSIHAKATLQILTMAGFSRCTSPPPPPHGPTSCHSYHPHGLKHQKLFIVRPHQGKPIKNFLKNRIWRGSKYKHMSNPEMLLKSRIKVKDYFVIFCSKKYEPGPTLRCNP